MHSCLDSLLRLRLPIDEANDEGQTPLHLAAQCGIPAPVEMLLRAGASVNIQDRTGNTPLHAVFFGDEPRPDIEYPIFHALVSSGVDRSIKNIEGKTPFDLAVEWGSPEQYLKLLASPFHPPTRIVNDSWFPLYRIVGAQPLGKLRVES